MNRLLRQLKSKMEAKLEEVKGLKADGKFDEANKAFDEYTKMKEDYDLELKLFNEESNDKSVVELNTDEPEKKNFSGFGIISKLLNKQRLTTEESKSLIVGGESGESNLLPEDVQLEINEVRSTYKSAKIITDVMPTSALTGSLNYDVDDDNELIEFADGAALDDTKTPKFEKKTFTIKFFGRLIPIGRILAGAEKGGLMYYINKWFVKKAIRTENKQIFAELAKDKTVKAVKGWKALKKAINMIDESCKLNGVIVTNQTGFSLLDEETFPDGKPVLQENPANKTQKIFQGLVIEVFTDKELPNVNGKAPLFVGDTKAGVSFVEYLGLEFAVSEHVFFGKNMNALRVIEGFDVLSTDKNAYEYMTFEATPAAVDPTPGS